MKFAAAILLAELFSLSSGSQVTIDSLYRQLMTENTDTGKALILHDLSYAYQMYKPDSALLLAQQAYLLSKKHHFLKGESWSLASMADAFHTLDNYPKAIEYYIEQLKIEEKRQEPENIASIYNNMASVYNTERDFPRALYYSALADSLVKTYHFAELALYTSLNIGDIYEKTNRLDSALVYTQKAFRLSRSQHNILIEGTALNNLGNIYIKRGDYQKALLSYKSGTPFLLQMADYNTLAECWLGQAKLYWQRGSTDSAYLYAKQVFNLAMTNEFLKRAIDASALLVDLFKSEAKIDSAFFYQNKMVVLKDSIDGKEKVRQLQRITLEEQLRQHELAEAKLQELEDRRQKLQLLAIGLAIPIFFFISVYLSRKKIHGRVIRFSGIISLLMLFEYITLLIHPVIAGLAHGPIFEIIIFVAIALVLTPLHHRIEHWLLTRLSKINEHHRQKSQPVPLEDA